jgi:high affinity Mn2+ porin
LSLISIVLLAVLAHDASNELIAADLTVIRKQRRKAPPSFDWTGLYIGANAGYGFGKSHTDALFSDAATGLPLFATSASSRFNGVLGGAQTGYNWKAGPWLLGIELDAQATNQRAVKSYLCPVANCNQTIVGFDAPVLVRHSLEMDWFGTLRARLGATITPETLAYATGGVAIAGFSHVGTLLGFVTTPVLDAAGNPVPGPNGIPLVSPSATTADLLDHTTKLGWAAGVGLEQHLFGNVTGKIEYLHMEFGRDFAFTGHPDNATPVAVTLNSRVKDDVMRVGINYRFDPDAPSEESKSKNGGSNKSRMVYKAPVEAVWSWTGVYIGGHVGYTRGRSRGTLVDPNLVNCDPTMGPCPPLVWDLSGPFGSLTGGAQIGYNHVLPSGVLVGVETDASFLNYLSGDDLAWSRVGPTAAVAQKIDYLATTRVRLGYAFPRWLVYATGGVAWSLTRFLETPGITDDTDKVLHLYRGWAIGGGAEVAIAPNWTARLEYLYRTFGHVDMVFASGVVAGSSFNTHSIRAGLNYRISPPWGETGGKSSSSKTEFDNWEIHGQTTYIHQGYPAFRSPYLGENSFTPWAQSRATWSTGLFLNVRLWDDGELYYNPELLQGFGLHDTTGAAGFPNGEAQKSNFAYHRYSTSRLYFRQTFEFGGEQETFESGFGRMAGKKDVSRLSIQVGRFTVHDVFDNNAYAGDPRVDFMNWSIWAAGAFDYPADKLGVGYGAVADFNQKYWALRLGYYLTGNQPNSNQFDMRLLRRGAYVGELETRHTLFSREGKIRYGIWSDTYFSGNYREALDLALANPNLDPTDAIIATRAPRTKYGYYINVEQSLTEQIGVFGRWSWNNGKNEITAFTDIDRSLSGGVSIKGKAWGRPDDRFGIAGAFNALSQDHRDYLAAGGLGILIGDGQLNYRPERILETYYAISLARWLTFALDYQYMVNPAHNADRGPISFFSGRLHGEF